MCDEVNQPYLSREGETTGHLVADSYASHHEPEFPQQNATKSLSMAQHHVSSMHMGTVFDQHPESMNHCQAVEPGSPDPWHHFPTTNARTKQGTTSLPFGGTKAWAFANDDDDDDELPLLQSGPLFSPDDKDESITSGDEELRVERGEKKHASITYEGEVSPPTAVNIRAANEGPTQTQITILGPECPEPQAEPQAACDTTEKREDAPCETRGEERNLSSAVGTTTKLNTSSFPNDSEQQPRRLGESPRSHPLFPSATQSSGVEHKIAVVGAATPEEAGGEEKSSPFRRPRDLPCFEPWEARKSTTPKARTQHVESHVPISSSSSSLSFPSMEENHRNEGGEKEQQKTDIITTGAPKQQQPTTTPSPHHASLTSFDWESRATSGSPHVVVPPSSVQRTPPPNPHTTNSCASTHHEKDELRSNSSRPSIEKPALPFEPWEPKASAFLVHSAEPHVPISQSVPVTMPLEPIVVAMSQGEEEEQQGSTRSMTERKGPEQEDPILVEDAASSGVEEPVSAPLSDLVEILQPDKDKDKKDKLLVPSASFDDGTNEAASSPLLPTSEAASAEPVSAEAASASPSLDLSPLLKPLVLAQKSEESPFPSSSPPNNGGGKNTAHPWCPLTPLVLPASKSAVFLNTGTTSSSGLTSSHQQLSSSELTAGGLVSHPQFPSFTQASQKPLKSIVLPNLTGASVMPRVATSTSSSTENKDPQKGSRGDTESQKKSSTEPSGAIVGCSLIKVGWEVGMLALPFVIRDALEKSLNRNYRKRERGDGQDKETKDPKKQKRELGFTEKRQLRHHSTAKSESVASETSDEDSSSGNSPKTITSRPSAFARRDSVGRMVCQDRVPRSAAGAGVGAGKGKIEKRTKSATAPVISESLYCGPGNQPSVASSGRLSASRNLTRRSNTLASNISSNTVMTSNTVASASCKTGLRGDMGGPSEVNGVHINVSKDYIIGSRGVSWHIQCEKLLEAFEDAYIILDGVRRVNVKILFEPINESQFPGYADKIHPNKAMDLLTIKQNLDRGQYVVPRDFQTDVAMTFENWMRYVSDCDDYHRLAHRLQRCFQSLWDEIERGESAIQASFQHQPMAQQQTHGFPGQAPMPVHSGHYAPQHHSSTTPMYASRPSMATRQSTQATGDGRRRPGAKGGRAPARRTRAQADDIAFEMCEAIKEMYGRLRTSDQDKVIEWLARGGDLVDFDEGEDMSFAIEELKPRRRKALHTLVSKLMNQDKRPADGYGAATRRQSSAGMNSRQHAGYQKAHSTTRRQAGHNTGYDPGLFSGGSSDEEPEPVFPFRRNNPIQHTPGRFSSKMDRESNPWQPSHTVEHQRPSINATMRAPHTIDRSRSPPPSPFGKPVIYGHSFPSVSQQQQQPQQQPAAPNTRLSTNMGLVERGTPYGGQVQSGSNLQQLHGGQGQGQSTYGTPVPRNPTSSNTHGFDQAQRSKEDMASFGESRKMPGNEITKRPSGYISPTTQEGEYSGSLLDKVDDVLAAFDEPGDTPRSTSNNNQWGGYDANGAPSYSTNAFAPRGTGRFGSSWPGTETSYE